MRTQEDNAPDKAAHGEVEQLYVGLDWAAVPDEMILTYHFKDMGRITTPTSYKKSLENILKEFYNHK